MLTVGRIFRWIVWLLIITAMGLFTIANHAPVTVLLTPFSSSGLSMPLWLVVIGSFIIGGCVSVSFVSMLRLLRNRRKRKEERALKE